MQNPRFAKRQRELARLERQRDKAQKRKEKRSVHTDRETLEGEDPDIAGIVPGPQPPRED